MRIHFIRNATLLIESGEHRILVDPMLGDQGCLPPMAFFRHRARLNPLTPLPSGTSALLKTATTALITHLHPDHLDSAGSTFLASKKLPTHCNPPDEKTLRRRRIDTRAIPQGIEHPFLDGYIRSTPTEHGYGFLIKLMSPGVGYLIHLPNEPSLYLTGDTVLTPAVRSVLSEHKPDITIFPAGTAQLDFGRPILMPLGEMIELVKLCPGVAIANHLESLNHCPTTRAKLRAALHEEGLGPKSHIPEDGDFLEFKARSFNEK